MRAIWATQTSSQSTSQTRLRECVPHLWGRQRGWARPYLPWDEAHPGVLFLPLGPGCAHFLPQWMLPEPWAGLSPWEEPGSHRGNRHLLTQRPRPECPTCTSPSVEAGSQGATHSVSTGWGCAVGQSCVAHTPPPQLSFHTESISRLFWYLDLVPQRGEVLKDKEQQNQSDLSPVLTSVRGTRGASCCRIGTRLTAREGLSLTKPKPCPSHQIEDKLQVLMAHLQDSLPTGTGEGVRVRQWLPAPHTHQLPGGRLCNPRGLQAAPTGGTESRTPCGQHACGISSPSATAAVPRVPGWGVRDRTSASASDRDNQ